MSTKINLRSINISPDNLTKQKQDTSKIMLKSFRSDLTNPQQTGSFQKKVSISTSRAQQNIIPLNELLTKLSHFRQLQQLPLNPVVQQKQSLWRDSPCTVRCISRNISVDRTEKFTIGSIYYRDNINEQKKVFTESQKPQLLLKNFRRQIDEASHSKHKYINKKSTPSSNQKNKQTIKFRSTMPLLQNKFYQVPAKTELKYDRNGCRSVYEGQYDVKKIIGSIRQNKFNFTSSRRIDLALPLNFYPGPGKYFIKNNQQINKSESFRRKRNKTLQTFNLKSTR